MIKSVVSKKAIGILKYMSRYLPLKTLDMMYKMFIRLHLDYCNVIYRIPHITDAFTSTITLKS